jgi:hypothetical protein
LLHLHAAVRRHLASNGILKPLLPANFIQHIIYFSSINFSSFQPVALTQTLNYLSHSCLSAAIENPEILHQG